MVLLQARCHEGPSNLWSASGRTPKSQDVNFAVVGLGLRHVCTMLLNSFLVYTHARAHIVSIMMHENCLTDAMCATYTSCLYTLLVQQWLVQKLPAVHCLCIVCIAETILCFYRFSHAICRLTKCLCQRCLYTN